MSEGKSTVISLYEACGWQVTECECAICGHSWHACHPAFWKSLPCPKCEPERLKREGFENEQI